VVDGDEDGWTRAIHIGDGAEAGELDLAVEVVFEVADAVPVSGIGTRGEGDVDLVHTIDLMSGNYP